MTERQKDQGFLHLLTAPNLLLGDVSLGVRLAVCLTPSASSVCPSLVLIYSLMAGFSALVLFCGMTLTSPSKSHSPCFAAFRQ